MSNGRITMDVEQGWMWKEAVVACFKVVKGLKKI
jgi:hypothetical protein